ncbi:hypothetical protein FOMA001_g2197 [Fusarium oxysporum f. sp. matthiolae]|nr:hypothetical protein FOMA001_g2197 [Fusarium oxysporum f. sp. matthiolae]
MVPISKRRLYLDGGTGSKPNHRRQEACGITSSSRGLTRRTATVPGKRRRGHFPEELDRRKTGCQGKELAVVRLELYKAQTAAFPTVASLTPTINPDPVAKDRVAETVGAPLSPVTRSTASAQLSERIPDPDKFKATRADLRRFHNAITEKLTVNRDRYPTAPYIRHGTCRLPDYYDILDILHKAYGDPNEARTARRKLDTIRQRDRDFATFYAEFQCLSLDSGLDDNALAPFLEKAISGELYDMLLTNPPY